MAETTLPPYLVRTAALAPDAYQLRAHWLNQAAQREQLMLGDRAGLTRTALHLIRVPPGTESTELHYHAEDDEWFYVLEGAGILEVKPGEDKDLRAEPVAPGDFVAFPAGQYLAHRFRNAGRAPLVYLCGGGRGPIEVCFYPEKGMRLVMNRVAGTRWSVPDRAVVVAPISAATQSESREGALGGKGGHVVHTAGAAFAETYALAHHGLDPTRTEWLKSRVGDDAGLTRVGVHFMRVRPGQTSTVMHWHALDDEWCFVLEAGSGAVLRVLDGEKGEKGEAAEHEVRAGDFAAFPAGKPWAHAFVNRGESELVYLCGGSRERVDECFYPEIGRRILIDRGEGRKHWVTSEKYVEVPSDDMLKEA